MIIAKREKQYICARCDCVFDKSQQNSIYTQLASYCSEDCFLYTKFGMNKSAIRHLLFSHWGTEFFRENWDKDKRN